MFGDGVDHRQQLAHARHEGHLLALACGEQAVVAGLERGIMANSRESGCVQGLRTSARPPHMERCPRI